MFDLTLEGVDVDLQNYQGKQKHASKIHGIFCFFLSTLDLEVFLFPQKMNFSSNVFETNKRPKKVTNGFRRGNLQTLFVESLTAHGRILANKLI